MTSDRDRADDAGVKLPTVVFRPWPPRHAPSPLSTRDPIRPCFVRAGLPVAAEVAPPAVRERAGASSPGPTGQAQRPRWIAPPPRFARFAAAIQSAGGRLGSEPVPWRAEPRDDVRAGGAAGRLAGLAAGALQPALHGLAKLAASGRGLRLPAIRRSALVLGAASAAALAMLALFEPTGGQDRGRPVVPQVEAGDVIRAPATADRYRPAAASPEPSLPDPLLVAEQPPAAAVSHPVAETAGPPTAPAGRRQLATVVAEAAVPAKAGPAAAAPAPVSLAGLSAEVRPTVQTTDAGLAADGKSAALAVRTGVLTDPVDDGDPLYELGRRLQDKGEIAQAIEAYRMAARANPGHAATYYDWGYLLQKQGDEAGARRNYLITLRLAPHHAFAHYNLGYLLQKHGQYASAIKHYQAAIAANPSFFWSYYNLGYIEQKQGHYRQALADYRKSIEVDPRQARSYENIATILRYHHAY